MRKSLTVSLRNLYRALGLSLFFMIYSVCSYAQISVTATAGTLGPTVYTRLALAFTAINAGTHQGVITISVTGNTTETATGTLNRSGTGAANYSSVLIKPAPGVNATIASALANGPIILAGCQLVTIDGSNTVGGTTQNLTITNTNTAGAFAIRMTTPGGNGCTGVVIKNCNITGRPTAPFTNGFGILAGGAALYSQATGSTADITIQNNLFSNWIQAAAYSYGATAYDFNWTVTGNTVTNNGFGGFWFNYSQGLTVSYNNINNCTITGTGNCYGINLSFPSVNDNIYGNQISNITNNYPAGAWGISLNTGSPASVNVYNNFVANIVSADGGTAAASGEALYVNYGGAQLNFYYNSVNQSVSQTSGITSGLCLNPLGFGAILAGSVNAVDNILVNTENAGTPYSVYCDAGTAPSNIFNTIDYNDYYAPSGNLGTVGGANYNTIATMQTGFGGNVNSILYDPTPLWTSSTNLHLTSVGSLAVGTPITTPIAIPNDIDVQTRSTTTPDIGADELINCTITPIVAPVTTVCPGSTITLSEATGGGTWSSASPGVATVVTGPATSTVVTGVQTTGGTSVITYATTGGCSVTTTVTVLAAPTISGTASVCVNSTTQLSSSVAGTWSTTTSSIATVTPGPAGGGTVTGVTAGTSLITFTSSATGCTTTISVTVKALPANITGTGVSGPICPLGTGNLAVFSATAGVGTWTSSNTTVATVALGPSGTSTVTGVSGPGTATITYTSTTTGCFVTAIVTVNAPPPPIFGAITVCAGSTTQLSNAVAGTWSSTTSSVATITPAGGLASGVTTGTSIITFTATSNSCFDTTLLTVTNAPGPISGAVPLCPGTTITLSNSVAGGTWTSSNSAVAAVTTGPSPTTTVTGVAGPGTVVVIYSLGTGCSQTANITVNALPAAIVGTFTVCPTATTQLSDAVVGTWTSTSTSVATITSGGGLVTGVSPGTSVITFTSSATGCIITTTVTVNSVPGAISGLTSVCAGSNITLSNAVPGGTWTSSNTNVATVTTGPGAGGGVVSGVPLAQGTTVITYSNGCSSPVVTVTVVASPLPITGNPAVCVGLTTSLSNASVGGIWSSATSSVATVTPGPGSGGGVVGGGSGGTTVISYSNGCGSATLVTVTVTPFPTAISGATSLCLGTTTTLSDGTSVGTWSSSNSSIAAIGSSTGFVNGNNNGTVTITYANVCGSANSSLTVTSPTAISGVTTFCQNATTTLSNGVSGGTWSSNNPAVATTTGIVNDGTVYGSGLGLSPGTATITYTIAGGCFVTINVTTTAAPTPITGLFSMCSGSSVNLTDGTTGGIWSSTNTNVATVNSTGLVSGFGIAGGTSAISYVIGICSAAATVTVNPIPAAITGPLSVCVNSTITLSDPTPSGNWSSSTSSVATVDPGNGTVSGVSAGVTTITYTLSSGCFITRSLTVNAAPASITGNVNLCVGSTTTLSDATGGGTWSSSASSIASVGSLSGVVTGFAPGGTATITYTAVSGCSTTTLVTVNPPPSAIIGANVICTGTTTTLTATPLGGTWSSVNTLVASIDINTGVVNAGIPGTTIITYTLGTGCTSTMTLSVHQTPVPIAGNTSVCSGSQTTLSDSPIGGVWTNSNISIATIGSVSGVVTALTGITTATTTTVIYTVAGCSATTTVVVNPLPGNIVGPTSVCVGLTIALTDNTGGGIWSSSSPAIASIGSLSGVITGFAPGGGATITDMLPTGCSRSIPVTVNPLPAAITGNTTICSGLTSTLSDGTSGGTWSSSNTLVATIGTLSGIVTARSVSVTSTSTITYTLVTGCTSTTVVTVNPLPAAIVGATTICSGGTTQLTDVTAGGVWSSSVSTVATIDPTGFVTGGIVVAPTIAQHSVITYSLTATGCINTTTITVSPLPTAISGNTTICAGLATQLSDGVGGGTWTSSNPGVATVGSLSGLVTGISTGPGSPGGTAIITYTVGTGCIQTVSVLVNPLPQAIAGNTIICAGLTTTLSDATPGGTWSSATSSVATIGSSTGIVTGATVLTQGTSRITYTLIATGCTATTIVTVNPLPATITGPNSVCEGATINLSESVLGGAWSSSNTIVASVQGAAGTGVVTGGSTGGQPSILDTITYTLGTGCIMTKTITVNIQPTAIINGPLSICDHASSPLSDAIANGVWTSGNTNIATVDPSLGVVTGSIPGAGVGGGTTNITYSVGSCRAVTSVLVNPQPVAITGNTTICSGSSTTLSDGTLGGGWSTSNSTVATVLPSIGGGFVTGGANPGGTAVITYSITNPTGSCIATTTVTVNSQPSPISGITNLCNSANTILSDTVAGGVWSSSNNLIATIGSTTGVVTGTGVGSVIMTYKIGNCSASITVNINTQPGPISGVMQVCNGFTTQLSDVVGGGVWSVNSGSVSILSVNSSGLVSGLSAGTGIVTHTLGSCFTTATVVVNPLPQVITGTFYVCQGSQTTLGDLSPGGTWSSNSPGIVSVGVNTGIITGVTTGPGIITYDLSTGCITTHTVQVIAAPAPIFPASTSVCVGGTIQLSDITNGGDWSTSNTNIAIIGSASGIVTGHSSGTVVVSYTLGSGCRVVSSVVVNPLAPVTGNTTVCVGQTTNLSDNTVGGTWSSAISSIATVNQVTGVVYGVTAGNVNIICTLSTGCSASASVTVLPLPLPITGITTICLNQTTMLSDASPGGVWSSFDPTIADVDPSSGLVTGDAAGSVQIIYTQGGCPQTTTVTVNPLTAPILGNTNICLGLTSALSDATPGGVWTSSNTNVATIDPVTGLVTSLSVGTSTIVYTPATGCVEAVLVTVNPLPGNILGNTAVCVGSCSQLSDAPSGGAWFSQDPTIASVGFVNGLLCGVSAGTTTITYQIVTGCITTATVLVNPLPNAISGASSVCVGYTTPLFAGPGPGVWSSSNTFVATVNPSTGVVTGVLPGTTVISYSLATGCASTMVMTVNPNPQPITGINTVCIGMTTQLFDVTGGGAWSSNNPIIASVDPSNNGVIYGGLSIGATTITYTLGTGCYITTPLVVNTPPVAITGPTQVCAGSQITLVDGVLGGSWTSSNTAAATIDQVLGTVTGVAQGSTIITYTMGGGTCFVTYLVTVNPLPLPITGVTQVCAGLTTTLSDASPGGTWSSLNTPVATVGLNSGVVTGVITGSSVATAVIVYTLPTTCSINTTVTVNPLPAPITGNMNICYQNTRTLSDSPSPGTWSSSNSSIAAVLNPNSGVVFGNNIGIDTITYTLSTTGCIMTTTVAVHPLPAVFNVTGGGTYCSGTGGVHIYLSGSEIGVTYLLYLGSTPAGSYTGTGYPLDFGLHIPAGVYTVVATNMFTTCSVNMTGSATVIITPTVIPTVSIIANPGDTVCAGTLVNYTTTSTHSGLAPAYQWSVNGLNVSTVSNYSFVPANGDVVTVMLAADTVCAIPDTVTSSLHMTVLTPVRPVVGILVSPNDTVCLGTPVTFTAVPSFGGTAPTYQWLTNGLPVAVGPVYTYTPSDGDVVLVDMTSNYQCRLANTVSSNAVTVKVDSPVIPVVTIIASPGSVISIGQSDTLRAIVTNGVSPTYQWFVDGVPVPGATSQTFIDNNFSHPKADSVSCMVTNAGACNEHTLGWMYIQVYPLGVTQVSGNMSDLHVLPNPNKGTFTIKGSLGTLNDEEVAIELTDVLGQVIYKDKIIAKGGNLNQQVTVGSNLANGMYMLNVRSESASKVFHVVIEQ